MSDDIDIRNSARRKNILRLIKLFRQAYFEADEELEVVLEHELSKAGRAFDQFRFARLERPRL